MISKAIRSGLMLIFSAMMTVSIQSQSLKDSRARIPFNFAVGNKTFEPGDYAVYVRRLGWAIILGIRNDSNRDRKEMLVATNARRSRSGKTILNFERVGDVYILTQLVSTRFGLTAPKSAAVKSTRPDGEAAIALSGKVKKGSTGVWGNVPMPPNAAVPDADIKTLVAWVLAQQK